MSTRINVSNSVVAMMAAITLLLSGCGGADGGAGNSPADVSNSAPVISGNPPGTVSAGAAYTFQPTATDANGDSLTFTIAAKPAWAAFNTSNGALTGTPSATNVGSYAGIQITVSDGKVSASLPAFSINVVAAGGANLPPTITGSPAASVVAGTAYDFTPSSADANGNMLTFSIQNKPSWATFSVATGQLTGTPATGNTGSFANIVISVSDGIAAAVALPAFTITVTQSGGGSVALNWTAPTLNADGSPLTDLSGYYIYYGTNANQLSQSVQVSGATQTSYTLTGLNSGTWYFAIASYNSMSVQSSQSNTASTVVM